MDTLRSRVLRDQQLWLEFFVLFNIGGLAVDIYIAHSVNQFRRPEEWIPFFFSLAAPVLLVAGLVAREKFAKAAVWLDLGYFVGAVAVLVGLAGVIYHLDSRFFWEQTIRSLTYAAPFAAPLSYTGLGLLLIMNRMVPAESPEWPRWVILLALGGFFGNFVLSLTDHAVNGFYRWVEWLPVVSSAVAVGFLLALFVAPISRKFLALCAAVLGLQVIVGLLGFAFHAQANLRGPSVHVWNNLINGAPPMAPLLFPNLVILAGIGLFVLDRIAAVEAGA